MNKIKTPLSTVIQDDVALVIYYIICPITHKKIISKVDNYCVLIGNELEINLGSQVNSSIIKKFKIWKD